MWVDHRDFAGQEGYVVDTGTNKRIPFCTRFNNDTLEYEAHLATPDGKNYQVDEDYRLITITGKAKGRMRFVPFGEAEALGETETPQADRIKQTIPTISPEQKLAGLEQYKQVYTEVWQWRGESRRTVDDRWGQFLADNDFLDALCLKHRPVPVTIYQGR